MPASFATTVFETAIADVMEMILQPRKAIPDILFGPKKKLSAQDIEKQIPSITVNSHLAQAVFKYMKRKELDEIEIGTARRVVMKVDERITANYNSLNWAQLLQPLFILAGPKIDTELFRIFFRDRNMDRISRRFDLLSGSLNKIEFIETLSSPDLLNEEGYEDDQVSLFDVQQKEDTDSDSTTDSLSKTNSDNKNAKIGDAARSVTEPESESAEEEFTELKEPKHPEGSKGSEIAKTDGSGADVTVTAEESDPDPDPEDEDDDDSLAGSFQTQRFGPESSGDDSEGVINTIDEDPETDLEAEDSDDDMPLNSRFDMDDDNSGNLSGEEEADDRFVDQFLYGKETESLREPDELSKSENVGKEVNVDSEITETEESDSNSDESDSEEGPIWQSFLGDEENIEESDIPEYSDSPEMYDDDEDADSNELPLIDLTVQQNDAESAQNLAGWLKDDEDRFMSQIFSGSAKAYEEALIDLNQLDNWKQASRFIEKEIFARNLVDMYDEEAVDFTDRLQAYFDEYKS